MNNMKQALENRRSIYAIGKESPISGEEIKNIVEHSVNFHHLKVE